MGFSTVSLKRLNKYPERTAQTLTALYGVQVWLGLLAWWPIICVSQKDIAANPAMDDPRWVILLLLIYSVGVMGHILKHALETTYLTGISIALLYTGFSIYRVEKIFPGAPA